jgi:hypothetical protein
MSSTKIAALLLSSVILVPVAFAQGRMGHPAPPQLQRVSASGTSSCSPDGLCLAVTVGLADPANPQACASGSSIVADVGDQLSWCYTLSNNSTQTLSWQTLGDTLQGSLFSEVQQDLAPSQSFQYVHLAIAGAVFAGDVSATWSASATRPTYTFDDSVAYDFIDASDGTLLDQTGGFPAGRTVPLQAPFPIDLFGTVTDQLCVGANGAIEVGTELCAIPSTLAFPSSYVPNAIAPAWSSYTDRVGQIYSKTLGNTVGQRRFVIEWKDMQLDFPTMDGFTFEVVIDEATRSYLFQYQSTGDGSGAFGDAGEQAIAGLQADTTTALQYSYFTPTLTPGLAVLWTLQQPQTFSVSADAQVDIGAAQLALPVTELDANAATGIRVTQPLVIGNDGNRTLTWSAGEYPASAVAPLPQRVIAAPAADAIAASAQRISTATNDAAAAPAQSGHVLGTSTVPAYAVQLDTGTGAQDFIGFDLLTPDPSLASIILPDIDQAGMNIAAGDFVDNDFSREWIIDYYADQLYTLDTSSGAKTLVGWSTLQNMVANEQWWGASWDPASGTLFASSNGSNGWSGLYSIDRGTAAATFIGQIDIGMPTNVADIAVDQNGQMYGLDTLNDVLLAIDKSSGHASIVGPLGVDAKFAQSIKFDRSNGTLYWTSYDTNGAAAVATIDPLTGIPTPVAPSGDHRQLFALAIAKAGGDCTQPLDAPWLSLETAAGSAQPGDPYGIYTVDFDATDLAPGTYDATICVFSNDPAYRTHPAAVPVHFNVAAGDDDTIFGDGFDG